MVKLLLTTSLLTFLIAATIMAQSPLQAQTLDMRDTIIPSDLDRFTAFVEKEQDGNTYSGYIVNDAGNVEFRVHDADTDDIVERQEFGDNGLALQFLEQEERWFEEMKATGVWVAPEEEEEEAGRKGE